jgi:two-component system, NtrC family, response regulator AtoC
MRTEEAPTNLRSQSYELAIFERRMITAVKVPDQGQLVIGRGTDVDVQLDSSQVSRRHAVLHSNGVQFQLEDLGSVNGTIVHGARLAANARISLDPGDAFRIGEFTLLLSPRDPTLVIATSRAPIGSSPPFQHALKQAAQAAQSDVCVLLLGETGAGKDVFARHVHELSPRKKRPFLRINCATLTEPLLESELFGHERGAFTGAVGAKLGLIESATTGTVFLDEIGELPERLQPKLLHVLESREVLRVGSVTARPIDVRFVVATNRDLAAEIAAKRFRSDLFYRLATFVIELPPLRARGDDVIPLATDLLNQAAARAGMRTPRIEDDAQELLRRHSWPGNVRELRNVIERALVISHGRAIRTTDLQLARVPGATSHSMTSSTSFGSGAPTPLRSGGSGSGSGDRTSDKPELGDAERDERDRIIEALTRCRGNQTEAARMLGMSRSTFLHRLDAYRITRPRKRPPTPV